MRTSTMPHKARLASRLPPRYCRCPPFTSGGGSPRRAGRTDSTVMGARWTRAPIKSPPPGRRGLSSAPQPDRRIKLRTQMVGACRQPGRLCGDRPTLFQCRVISQAAASSHLLPVADTSPGRVGLAITSRPVGPGGESRVSSAQVNERHAAPNTGHGVPRAPVVDMAVPQLAPLKVQHEPESRILPGRGSRVADLHASGIRR